MEWLYLGIAGAMEVLWSTFLKFSEGFTKPMPTVITLAGLAASMFFLAKAAKVLPIGTAYGIWTGIGALGAVIVLLLWLYLASVMLIMGAEFNSVLMVLRKQHTAETEENLGETQK